MAWTIEYNEAALKDLRKFDRQVQREILDFMDKRIAQAEDPRSFGKPLRHSKFGLWRPLGIGVREIQLIASREAFEAHIQTRSLG